MGLLSVARKVGGAAAKVARNPLVQTGLQMIPGAKAVSTGLKVAGAMSTAYGGYSAGKAILGTIKGSPAGLPALPGVGFSMPGLKVQPGQTGGGVLPSKWIPRGPGGRMQLPWNDPSVPAFLKQFALDDSFIKPAMRAPRGYVIIRDADGQPYPVLKKIAQQFGLWKPGKKPPISVGDFQALKRADRTVKKMRKIYATIARVDKATTKGGKVAIHKKKGK